MTRLKYLETPAPYGEWMSHSDSCIDCVSMVGMYGYRRDCINGHRSLYLHNLMVTYWRSNLYPIFFFSLISQISHNFFYLNIPGWFLLQTFTNAMFVIMSWKEVFVYNDIDSFFYIRSLPFLATLSPSKYVWSTMDSSC